MFQFKHFKLEVLLLIALTEQMKVVFRCLSQHVELLVYFSVLYYCRVIK